MIVKKIMAIGVLSCLLANCWAGRATARVSRPVEGDMIRPLTTDCLISAAEHFHLPVSALLAILDVEGGTVGYEEINRNGTTDMGPAQINSVHMPRLRAIGLNEGDIARNGCLNIHVAAMLLREKLNATGNILDALGEYHSRTPTKKARYQQKIRTAYLKLRAAPERQLPAILKKANKGLKQ